MPAADADAANVPPDLIAAIESMRRPVVVGHVVPDADCLGAMLAIARAWPGGPSAGGAVCLPANSVSRRLRFLVDWAAAPVVGPDGLSEADGFIVVDAASLRRCNVGTQAEADWRAGRPVVVIDHHATNTGFGDINWVASSLSSSAEMVYRAIRAAGRPLDAVTASLLYAGVHADTRGFTAAGMSAGAMEAAAQLIECGARVGEIGERLYRSHQENEFRLVQLIHANTKLIAGGRIAYSTADFDEIAACGCSPVDIDEQVDIPRSMGGIALAMMLTEGTRRRVRINLRGEAGTSVLPLALELGGGGHQQAAGVVLECPMAEALDRVLPLAEKHLKLQQAGGDVASPATG